MTEFPDKRVAEPTHRAAKRLLATIDTELAMAGPYVRGWLDQVLAGAGIADAYLARRSHPLAHLPVWAADSANAELDEHCIEDLAYSSMNGYFFIRLIDDVMDADGAGGEARLLPALALFHTEFAEIYHQTFPSEHSFWAVYRREWVGTADAAVADSHSLSIDRDFFLNITARKTRALLIPVAAALHLVGRPELTESWEPVLRWFGAWQQFYNDFFGWVKDATHGATTFVLSESRRGAEDGAGPSNWIWRNGVDWSAGVLADFEVEIRGAASQLGSNGLDEYLEWRFTEASDRMAGIHDSMIAMSRLMDD